jgi:hypothetical protein
MSGQFEWVDPRPKLRLVPPYVEFQADHDQHPLWPHGGRVPGAGERQARHARAVAEALIRAVPAGPHVYSGDCLIPTDSTEQEALDGTTIDLPDDEPYPDEPADLPFDHLPDYMQDGWDR